MSFSLHSGYPILLAQATAAKPEQAAGSLFILTMLLLGAWKCWSISRRPTTNTKCVLGLMFLLLGWAAAALGAALASFRQPGGENVLLALSVGLLFLAMLGLMVAAVVLAIVGLVETAQTPGRFTQGRGQAIWTLVLAGFLGLCCCYGVVRGVQRSNNLLAGSGQSRPGQVLTFDDSNFRFRTPARPWVSFDASKLNKAATLGFARQHPEAYLLVLPEKVGVRSAFTVEQLAETGKAHLKAAATSSRVLSEAPLQVNGVEGLLVETEASRLAHNFYYLHWYVVTNGYTYQLVGYCDQASHRALKAEFRQLLANFQLLDPNRVAAEGEQAFTTDFTSPLYGYSVQVKHSQWQAFASLDKNFPQAEFGGSRGDSCFVVVPVWLGGQDLDPEALAAGLLALMNVRYPNEELTHRKPLAQGNLGGVQYDFERTVDSTPMHYQFQLLSGNGNGYLVAAWSQRRAADAETVLPDALARVHFTWPPLERLSEKTDFTARERRTQGFVLNHAGLYHFNTGEFEKALPLFCAAWRANNQEPLYGLNALQTWRHLERPKEALEFLNGPGARMLEKPEARAWQAFFQAEAALTEPALSNYAKLFASGFRNEEHLSEYVGLLNAQEQYDRALAEVQAYLQKGDSITTRLLEANIYRRKGDIAKAISLLKQQHETAPFNSSVSTELVKADLEAGYYREALELSRSLVKGHNDSALAHYLEGRSELGLKWYREAKAAFEAAGRLAPAEKEYSALLAHVQGMLGEGSNSALKDPIAPVALPAALTNALAEAAPQGYAQKYGAYYDQLVTAVSWLPRKEYKTTDFLRVRVLDASGVSAFSTVQTLFNPLSEEIFVNDVRVLDAAGKTISTGNVSSYYVLDNALGNEASQEKVLNIPVPGLEPGCQLAVTITRRALGRLDEMPFLEHSFSRAFPVRTSALVLSGEGAAVKSLSAGAVRSRTFPEGRCWQVQDPVVSCWEPLQAPLASFAPMVWLADASATWPALGSNYLGSISNCLEPDATVRDLAQQLVAGLEQPEAKLAALCRHVQTNYTYKAIEFGRRARIPNKPADIIRNKYGDCKDHALLLQQLLQAVGIPANLALVSHHSLLQKDLPSLDQFDHMLVYLPTAAAGRFVDCTDKGADIVHAIPLGQAGRLALVLDAGNSRLVPLPAYPETASTIELHRRLRLVEPNEVVVEESLALTGVHAGLMRDFLLRLPPASERRFLQKHWGLEHVDLTDFTAQGLETTEAPLRLHCRYTLKQQFHQTHDRLTGTLPGYIERAYLSAEPVYNRVTPFEVFIPLVVKTVVELEAPPGFVPETPQATACKLDPRFATGQGRAWCEGNRLHLEFQCRQLPGKFAASNYPAYRETMAQALALLEKEVVFKAEAK